MASTIQLKFRATGGGAGAPASLASGEVAYNMADGKFYVGYGDNGSGIATSIKVFAADSYVDPSTLYQVKNNDLTALAALASTGVAVRTGTNTWAQRTITGTATRIGVTNGDGVAGNPTLDLATVAVGSVTTGGSTKFTVDGYGRVTNASQASLTDLSAPTADMSVGGFKLTNVGTASIGTDAANKAYVDNLIQGLQWKASVRCATTANISLTGEQTLDGITTSANRVLVKNQTTASQNGIYISAAGAWTRATDAATWQNLVNATVFVEQGTTYADSSWTCTSDVGGTLGTTNVAFAQTNGNGNGFNVAGTGLTSAGNTVSLTGQALALHQVTTAVDQVIYATGSGTFNTTSFPTFGRSLVGATSAATAQSTLGLVIGTNVDAYSARTTALGGLSISTADNVVLYGASNAVAAYQLGATGKSLMAAASAGAAQTTLGLGTMATQNSTAIAVTGGTMTGVAIQGGSF